MPVVVGEDYQAALLWKALFDAGVYTNVAIHPAVPPGGALLRTSLMATHEREHLDRALEIIERRSRTSRTSAAGLGPFLRGTTDADSGVSSPCLGSFVLSDLAQGQVVNKKFAISERTVTPIAAVLG